MTDLYPVRPIWAREYATPYPMARTIAGSFPITKIGANDYSVELSMATTPGALFQSISGFFVDTNGNLVNDLGRWFADSAGSPRPVPASTQAQTLQDPFWFRTDANGVAYTQGECGQSNGSTPIFDEIFRSARLVSTAGTTVDAAAVEPTHFQGVVTVMDPGIAWAFYTLLPPIVGPGVPLTQLAIAGGGAVDVRAAAANPAINIFGCGGAFNGPDGVIWIAPGDIGANPGQIPADPAENTPNLFQQHPSVFVRQTNAVRGLKSWGPVDGASVGGLHPFVTLDITAAPTGITLLETSRAPTHSEWIFLVDGEFVRAIVEHPAGSDFRRPRDIWNNVIVGALQTQEGLDSGTTPGMTLWQTRVNVTNVFEHMGRLRHLKYIQAGLYVRPWDATIAVPWTVEQQGG